MEYSKAKKIPPDGGYGWIVTLAYALNNVVVLPVIAGFGLVFQEAFEETQLTASQGTLVITLNHGIGMLLSFFGGPLLRSFGYRKVAVVGALLIFFGLIFTSLASTFWVFILAYSILNSMGIAAVMAAFTLAINSFFDVKRGRAIGVGMSITGLGAIYMPLVMSLLISTYGWRGAVLVLAAICLHSLLGATLLRPAKWYLLDPLPIGEELTPLNKDNAIEFNESSVTTSSKHNGILSLPTLQESIHEEVDHSRPKSISMHSLDNNISIEARNAISHPDLRKKELEPMPISKYKWWESQEYNLGSSINIFHEPEINTNKKEDPKEIDKSIKTDETEQTQRKGLLGISNRIVEFFDLTLLNDAVFVNILLGLSIAACVETNFSLLLPIILKDMLEFETSQIAQIMAVIGFSDTLFRLASPFIGEWCHKPPRVMYLVSLMMIVFTRTIMLFATTFKSMVVVGVAIGITKGVRTVYMNIVIPSHVPIERLPFASGIQMFVNGIIIISIGSLLGRLREASGAYRVPIIVLNVVTMITVVMWSLEFIYFRLKKKPEVEPSIDI